MYKLQQLNINRHSDRLRIHKISSRRLRTKSFSLKRISYQSQAWQQHIRISAESEPGVLCDEYEFTFN